MIKAKNQILADIALEQNYKVVKYLERRGIKGFIEWWAIIKKESKPEDIELVISTPEKFGKVIVNGIEYHPLT